MAVSLPYSGGTFLSERFPDDGYLFGSRKHKHGKTDRVASAQHPEAVYVPFLKCGQIVLISLTVHSKAVPVL
mgnify:CR=1 FL=1